MKNSRSWLLGAVLAVLLSAGCATRPPPAVTTADKSVASQRSAIPSIIRIATFNIRDFGKTKSQKPEIMATLADIVRQYDVVAVQEISDATGQVPLQFLQEINRDNSKYAVLVSPRTGKQADDAASAEQYAFYYNTGKLRAQDQGGLYPDDAHDLFQREPFVAGFSTIQENVRFVLITIHTAPEKARTEIPALAATLDWARNRYMGQDGYIILGDFNASGTYASATDLNRWRTNELPYRWIVPDDADTNVSATSSRAYDRILVTDSMAARFTGHWGVARVFTDGHVSDHWPVWAEFSLRETE